MSDPLQPAAAQPTIHELEQQVMDMMLQHRWQEATLVCAVIIGLLKEVQPPAAATQEDTADRHVVPDGHRVILIDRDGSWLEESPAGWRRRYSFVEPLQPAAAAPPIDLLDLEPIKRRILIHDEEIENSNEISYAEWEENNDYLADNDVKGLLAEVERLRGVLARLRALQGTEK